MPKRSGSHPKRPRDVNELAALIVDETTRDAPEPEPASDTPPAATVIATPPDDGKNPAAVALGRLGGKKGGKARMAGLSPDERSDLGKKAAAARWRKLDTTAG